MTAVSNHVNEKKLISLLKKGQGEMLEI